MERKITAILENEGVYAFYDVYTDEEKGAVIRGRVFGDTKGRFDAGDLIRTSAIIYVQGQYVYTRNSLYKVEW